jgi:CO/xanthine dehydrogenase Mo-binding subunit
VVGLAAQRLNQPPEQLQLRDGRVLASDGKSVGYGELVAGQELHVQAQPQSVLRSPDKFNIMGHHLPRLDIPAKLTGGPAYVQDLRLPGMVHARVLRPPSPGAQLKALDTAAIEKLPGVLKVVRDGRFVAVIAQKEWQAVTAWKALATAAQWDESETLAPQATLYRDLLAAPRQDIVIAQLGTPFAEGGRQVVAGYLRPFQLHGSIGPSCAVAQVNEGMTTVWTHSQGVFPLRKALAELLAQPPEKLRCIHVEGSGCYGHNAADDVAADAALLAQQLPGKPVRVQWMREDEHMWEPYGPPMVTGTRAALDANGSITSWEYEVWSNTHSSRPGAAGDLLAGQHIEKAFTPSPPRPGQQPEGAGDRNAIPLYKVPNLRVTHHFLPQGTLRTSALRGLGAYMNVFSIESFMDELARAAGADPVEFRLKHLADPRAQAVIKLAAQEFGWSRFPGVAGHGRGFAFARYKNLAAYAAIACEVELRRDTGELRILRVVAAVDSGEVTSPDGIRNQMEGGIVQSCSWTLSEEVVFDRTRILSRDWAGYPILRFPRVPQSVEVHIIPRPGTPFLGTGEAAQGPTAAALANALADAGGVRIRQIPFSSERIRGAFAT